MPGACRQLRGPECLLCCPNPLSALGSDTTPLPSWAALHSSTWGSLKQALKGLSVEFAVLADKAAQQVSGRQPERLPQGRSTPRPAGRLFGCTCRFG